VQRKTVARLLAGVLAFVLIVIVIAERKHRAKESELVPLEIKPTQSAPSESDLARQREAEQEAQRQREAEQRKREVEQQQELERWKRSLLDKARRSVKACASSVRERSDAKHWKGFSSFDAYASGEYGENVSFFGTPEERFQFEKCMAENGNPLTKRAEDEKK
jgi:hypothetical protein